MVRLGSVVIGATDVERAVAFWAEALGYEIVRFDDADDGFTILRPPSGEGTRVAVHQSATAPQAQPRIHVDLIVADVAEQRSEVGRLVTIGAERVEWDYPADPDFVVLADPDGNRFCVVDAGHG